MGYMITRVSGNNEFNFCEYFSNWRGRILLILKWRAIRCYLITNAITRSASLFHVRSLFAEILMCCLCPASYSNNRPRPPDNHFPILAFASPLLLIIIEDYVSTSSSSTQDAAEGAEGASDHSICDIFANPPTSLLIFYCIMLLMCWYINIRGGFG